MPEDSLKTIEVAQESAQSAADELVETLEDVTRDGYFDFGDIVRWMNDTE